MSAVTATPRLLVKTAAAPARLGFQFQKTPFEFRTEPLFASVQPETRGLAAAAPRWHIVQASAAAAAPVNAWDLCHHLLREGFGAAGEGRVEFAEPDLEQQWISGEAARQAFAAAQTSAAPAGPDGRLPNGDGLYWFRDAQHSGLEAAREAVGRPADPVRIAHCDTGYDPQHATLPRGLRRDLQKNFVDDALADDASDRSQGFFNQIGHGTGTLSILAGAEVDGKPLGGAPYLDVIPLRVADSVVLFRTSAIARAFDYVHGLWADPARRAHVVTMSMGGLASQAWAEAVNALYELGVFIVTAAGNNFGNLPTRNIVYPARFRRVTAACGAMADGRPYADLPIAIMAGNYGPRSKMATAMAGYTPNTPWARMGFGALVDRDGRGTSAATPQVAAAAALWIQKNKAAWEAYPQGWMRVEAVRKALFDSARLASPDLAERLGRGAVRADAALSLAPAAVGALRREEPDSASFALLRVLTGLGAAPADARHTMLELEALQLAQQSTEIESLLPDPDEAASLSPAERRRIVEALHAVTGASAALRAALEGQRDAQVPVPSPPEADPGRLALAANPQPPKPERRRLRVFTYDPLLAYSTEFLDINQTTLDVRWEELRPGPVGEYLEVVDVDPASGCCYAPVDLDHPWLLAQSGLAPSEKNPRFHQQMVYAVAMRTIETFERALGRAALWAPRIARSPEGVKSRFVRRLRIYPHALREANAFYSPEKKALLLGYFRASETEAGGSLPGGVIFTALSHDIVAHETTHALLDGLHRYFAEPSNPDVLAFHEAFADVVAIFQHFTIPEALRDAVARTRGDLAQTSLLADLARQFGGAMGRSRALRSAIDNPDVHYQNTSESHERGAVLVAAVFDAFLAVYKRRSRELLRIATGGTGVLPQGEIQRDLTNRLADEAARTAANILQICVRALDYCPPVDPTFGEYLRALITADRDLVPADPWGYRAAFVEGFRKRRIALRDLRTLSPDEISWEAPDFPLDLSGILPKLDLSWSQRADRRRTFGRSRRNGKMLHQWIAGNPKIDTLALGFARQPGPMAVGGEEGKLKGFEVHSVRPLRRVGPDGHHCTDLVIEITQRWVGEAGSVFRGGCTLLADLERGAVRYVVRKRIDNLERWRAQQEHRSAVAFGNLAANYAAVKGETREPFAMLHRSFGEEDGRG